MIRFFAEGVKMMIEKEDSLRSWILLLVHSESWRVGEITYIFCSDEYLLALNRDYLAHDYYTDILTFPSDAPAGEISADIYISIDRVAENATELGLSFQDELHRVMVHGIFHLMGYDDHDENEALMRAKEEKALSERPSDLFHVER